MVLASTARGLAPGPCGPIISVMAEKKNRKPETRYFVLTSSGRKGPYDLEALAGFLRKGKLKETTQVAGERGGDVRRLRDVLDAPPAPGSRLPVYLGAIAAALAVAGAVAFAFRGGPKGPEAPVAKTSDAGRTEVEAPAAPEPEPPVAGVDPLEPVRTPPGEPPSRLASILATQDLEARCRLLLEYLAERPGDAEVRRALVDARWALSTRGASAWRSCVRELPASSSPHPPRLVHDSRRGVTFAFQAAGKIDEPLAVWRWDGSEAALASSEGPPHRAAFDVAHDAERGVTVLFGGLSRGDHDTLRNDTWEWDGERWAQASPDAPPPPRAGHAMVWDAARRRVVLFGGYGDSSRILGDTWEWDGSRWTEHRVTGPPARSLHALAYDPGRERVVLFGGEGWLDRVDPEGSTFQAQGEFEDTWEWDGARWSEAGPAVHPPARGRHAMAHHPGLGATFLFGGYQRSESGSGQFHQDAWTWDGREWRRLDLADPPDERVSFALVADDSRSVLVLAAGFARPGRFLCWELGIGLPPLPR